MGRFEWLQAFYLCGAWGARGFQQHTQAMSTRCGGDITSLHPFGVATGWGAARIYAELAKTFLHQFFFGSVAHSAARRSKRRGGRQMFKLFRDVEPHGSHAEIFLGVEIFKLFSQNKRFQTCGRLPPRVPPTISSSWACGHPRRWQRAS
jgi:hypothetical protein